MIQDMAYLSFDKLEGVGVTTDIVARSETVEKRWKFGRSQKTGKVKVCV
jgi:hypothetical protein